MTIFDDDKSWAAGLRPAALAIYQRLFPGCMVEEHKIEDGKHVHELDKGYGIDCHLRLSSKCILTLQEKYRRNSYYRFHDYTQEYINGFETAMQKEGEWFHMAADFCFYGWADEAGTGFVDWMLIDVSRFKASLCTMDKFLEAGVKWIPNKRHGSALFFTLPVESLRSRRCIYAEKTSMEDATWDGGRPDGVLPG